jgi:hypothetical protein
LGQGPVWPANLSLTLKRARHLVQTTEMAMRLVPREQNDSE